MAVDVSDALPDVTLAPESVITVTLDDVAAKITRLNVYAVNPVTGQLEEITQVQPLLAYVPLPAA